MATANHISVRISRLNESLNTDPHYDMYAHTLTITPNGHLNIEGQPESRTFAPGTWDGIEVRLLLRARN